ncbi:MAG: response regulator [Verrucomicrobiota bacterium]
MKKILVIEDDLITANIYRNKYLLAGYQVETAPDGEAGIKTMLSFRPDVLQLDLMLPKLNGVEVIKRVRAHPDFKNLPILVLSNSYLTSLVQEAWKAGATKCISKADCNPKLMIEIVEKILCAAPAPAPTSAGPTIIYATQGMPLQSPRENPADADAVFQSDLRRAFLEGAPNQVNALRAILKGFIKADTPPPAKQEHLLELYRKIRSFGANASLAGLARTARVCAAVEALAKELHDNAANQTPSALRTFAQAIDALARLVVKGANADLSDSAPPNILVVDDEPISRMAVARALEKAGLKSMKLEDPHAALSMLTENRFDLVFLDVDMPGMNGFELCQKVRALPAHAKTPIVFVTAMTDFESRAKSALSGGNDLIAKPFLFSELAVKALIHVYHIQSG